MTKERWFRIVLENGKIWLNGIRKKNFKHADVVPDNSRGFIIINGDKARFIADEDMNKPRIEVTK